MKKPSSAITKVLIAWLFVSVTLVRFIVTSFWKRLLRSPMPPPVVVEGVAFVSEAITQCSARTSKVFYPEFPFEFPIGPHYIRRERVEHTICSLTGPRTAVLETVRTGAFKSQMDFSARTSYCFTAAWHIPLFACLADGETASCATTKEPLSRLSG